VVPIEVPPLRNRIDDIPILVDIFLKEAATTNRDKRKTIDDEAMNILTKYTWPGNVRELKNLIERMAIMVQKETISVRDLPANLSDPKTATGELFSIDDLNRARTAFETEYIRKKLAANDNDVEKTASAIGVKPQLIKSVIAQEND
jgi:two-component system nitrogen regulation response regulator NtrX